MQIELIKKAAGKDNKNPKNILIMGVMHGDEEQGEYLINKYLSCVNNQKELEEPINNLYYIPRLNFSKTRTNKNGVDINRNFPTKNWGQDTSAVGPNAADYYGGVAPGSEDETKFIVSLMDEIDFDAIITIHAPYKIVNYDGDKDGEALKLAKIVSEITGYPVEGDIGYPTPGSFGTYAGIERDIPVITIEVDEDIPVENLYVKFQELFNFLENAY